MPIDRDGKRSDAEWPKLPRPSSTLPRPTIGMSAPTVSLRGKADSRGRPGNGAQRAGANMKYIFFTGATGGLGSPCVKALSERGYAVFAAALSSNRLSELGKLPNVIPVSTDITDMESVLAARKMVEKITPKLYAVVNFAGLAAFCSMVEGDCIRITEKLFQVNVMGMVRVNRVFFDLLYAGNGRIIDCSSEAGWMTAQPFAAPYYLSKHAVEAYNDSLRRELMYLGIPVIKIQPGSFRTGILDTVNQSFDKTLMETAHYKKILYRMKPLMIHELNRSGDPKKLVAALIKAVEAKNPKIRYRSGTGKLLAMMNILPEKWLDTMYQLLFNR
jgi:NAD(P)-dependent dehydrogenase (short-subunit alcohol dehydrogenase family)